MKCFQCKEVLICDESHDIEEDHDVVKTNVRCPSCNILHTIYKPKEKDKNG